MRNRQGWLTIIWLFILAVTVVDVGVAVAYRAAFAEWEMNPLAVMAAAHIGMTGLAAYKLGVVGLGFLLVRRVRHKVAWIATAVAAAPHVYLLVVYALFFCGLV